MDLPLFDYTKEVQTLEERFQGSSSFNFEPNLLRKKASTVVDKKNVTNSSKQIRIAFRTDCTTTSVGPYLKQSAQLRMY
jgi:hypothetical protein